MELTSSINEELPTTHVVSVTCGPTGQAAVAAIQPTGLVASVQPTPQDTSATLPRDETAHTLPDPPTPPVAMDSAVEMESAVAIHLNEKCLSSMCMVSCLCS